MFNECRHILTSGYKCKAAALRGQAFCYYHSAARRYAHNPGNRLQLPSVEDTGGVQIAIDQILRGLGSRRIEPRQAGLFLYGLQIASKFARKSKDAPTETVRELSPDPEHGDPADDSSVAADLAPEKTTCEPPKDCIGCPRRNYCEDFDYWESDVEELEERLEREANEEEEEQDEQEQDSE